jgi:hypothetical protein
MWGFCNRLLQWRYAMVLAAACLLSAKWMDNTAANLDRLSDRREQALAYLQAIHTRLADMRGRDGTTTDSQRSLLQSALSDRSMEELFPGMHPVPRNTHAGLLLHLEPSPEERG